MWLVIIDVAISFFHLPHFETDSNIFQFFLPSFSFALLYMETKKISNSLFIHFVMYALVG